MSKLKYFDGTNWNEVNGNIVGDTLPIGTEVDYIGENVPVGWQQVDDVPKVLYNDPSGTTGTVNLSETAANFTYLEIFYQSADAYNSIKVYSPNGKKIYLTGVYFATNTDGNVKRATMTISGTSITKNNYVASNFSGSNIWEENGISIVRVVGYK